jgi:diguanylate cyclase (GGDEF)-like protein
MTTADSRPSASSATAAWAGNAAVVQILRTVLERHGEFLTVKDATNGRYVYVDAAMSAFLRRDAAALVGCTDADVFDSGMVTAFRAAEQTALAQSGPLVSDHRFEWGGARRDFKVTRLHGTAGADGTRWLFAVWSDQGASEQRDAQLRNALGQLEREQKANELLRLELSDHALRDQASGLYTRAHFEDQLRREVDLSTREHREFALVFIELDKPTAAVSQRGEAARSRVLDAMGRLLRGGTRAMDSSCRYEASRFAVLLSGVGLATAHSRMEGLRRQCATQIVVLDGQDLGFTVSMGVASFPHTAHTQDELVASCDAALAEALRRGGNHVTLASIRFELGA